MIDEHGMPGGAGSSEGRESPRRDLPELEISTMLRRTVPRRRGRGLGLAGIFLPVVATMSEWQGKLLSSSITNV